MKTIGYDERASFFEFLSEDEVFISSFAEHHNLKSVLQIPCGNGRSVPLLSQLFSSVVLGDINPSMIECTNDVIQKYRIKNSIAYVLDLKNLSIYNLKVDTILIMQQSFQLLNKENARLALKNMHGVFSHSIVIDLFDFTLLDSSKTRPYYLREPRISFMDRNGKFIRRTTEFSINKDTVLLLHNYVTNDDDFVAKVEMTNFTYSEFINLCNSCEYEIVEYYNSYRCEEDVCSGQMIFVLRDRKAHENS